MSFVFVSRRVWGLRLASVENSKGLSQITERHTVSCHKHFDGLFPPSILIFLSIVHVHLRLRWFRADESFHTLLFLFHVGRGQGREASDCLGSPSPFLHSVVVSRTLSIVASVLCLSKCYN